MHHVFIVLMPSKRIMIPIQPHLVYFIFLDLHEVFIDVVEL